MSDLAARPSAPSRTAGEVGAFQVPRLAGRIERTRFDGGLSLAVLAVPEAPVVTTALCYRVGTRDEAQDGGGLAHFLEHLMFRGGRRFGPGEIDRLTQSLGGDNNAFTSHDATVYYFRFAPAHWRVALEIEVDRMKELLFDPEAVERERRVILEEIAMYRNDPWDALEQDVQATLYGDGYGDPILGTTEELLATEVETLRTFHQRRYVPQNALLVVVGAVTLDQVLDAAAPFSAIARPAPPRSAPQRSFPSAETVRVDRHCGEVARLLVAQTAPPGDTAAHAQHRLVQLLLTGGRSSRLVRRLVDELRWCSWLAGDLSEHQGISGLSLALEVVPGVEPSRVEAELVREIERLGTEGPSQAELERVQRIAVADWVFSHERLHHRALAIALGEALFAEQHSERQLERLAALDLDQARSACAAVANAAAQGRARRVVGWSLPA